MTALEILIAARDWLAVGPERWCQWVEYQDAQGDECDVWRRASCCIVGAIKGADPAGAWLDDGSPLAAWICLERVVAHPLGAWNDSLPPGRAGWERVIEAFGKAIEAEKARTSGSGS